MSKKLNMGLRQYQTGKAIESQTAILMVLSYDEDFHRYTELKENTKLSDATLSKQLRILKEMKLIERKLDTESGKYPPPVYYRLNPVYVNAFRGFNRDDFRRQDVEKKIEWQLSMKNPLEIIKEVNDSNNLTLLGILLYIKENRTTDERITRFLLELLLWYPYRIFTEVLVEKTWPIVDKFDIKQLVVEM